MEEGAQQDCLVPGRGLDEAIHPAVLRGGEVASRGDGLSSLLAQVQ